MIEEIVVGIVGLIVTAIIGGAVWKNRLHDKARFDAATTLMNTSMKM